MRSVAAVFALALLAGCMAKETPAPPPPPPALTLADFAGTWTTTATLTGAAAPVVSTMVGDADATKWTLTLPGRPALPLTVAIVGDSVITQTGEYESVLRKGVMVSTRTASVRSNGELKGNVTATYKAAAGTEVVLGTTSSVRAAPK